MIPFTTAAGLAIVALAPVVGSLLGAADTAFQGGDMGSAMGNIASSILELAGHQLASKTGIKMNDADLAKLGNSLGTLAADATGLQQQYGGKFTDTWNAIAQNLLAGKYGDVTVLTSPDVKDAISKAMGDPAAQLVFRKGYDISEYADAPTLQAVSQLFTDSGAMHLFQFGAGLGLLKRAADLAKSGTSTASVVPSGKAKGRTMTTGNVYVGDFGDAMGSALGSAFGSLLSTAASEGSKAIDQQLGVVHAQGGSPAQVLATLIGQLGAKYGVYPGQTATSGLFVGAAGELYDEQGRPVVPVAVQEPKHWSFSHDVLPALPAAVELAAAALPFVAGPVHVGSNNVILDFQRLYNHLNPNQTIVVDGVMQSETQGAVLRTQRDAQLPMTGQIDDVLLSYMRAATSCTFTSGVGPTMVGVQSIGWWDSRFDYGQVGDGGGYEYWGSYPGEYPGEYSIEGGGQ